MKILNIAFYRFAEVSDVSALRTELREFCRSRSILGTILVSSEGVNGSLAGEETSIREFQHYIEPRFPLLEYKESWSDGTPFKELFIKLKKEIIPLGLPSIRPAERTGKRISPLELKSWLDEGRDILLLDTRNRYEIEHGTFEKAVDLGLRTFRKFPDELKKMPKDARGRTLVMFCTGGIRCEKASVVAMDEGFQDVYQLDGGILRYFEECGGSHYRGDCFVFDERVTVAPPRDQNTNEN